MEVAPVEYESNDLETFFVNRVWMLLEVVGLVLVTPNGGDQAESDGLTVVHFWVDRKRLRNQEMTCVVKKSRAMNQYLLFSVACVGVSGYKGYLITLWPIGSLRCIQH